MRNGQNDQKLWPTLKIFFIKLTKTRKENQEQNALDIRGYDVT